MSAQRRLHLNQDPPPLGDDKECPPSLLPSRCSAAASSRPGTTRSPRAPSTRPPSSLTCPSRCAHPPTGMTHHLKEGGGSCNSHHLPKFPLPTVWITLPTNLGAPAAALAGTHRPGGDLRPHHVHLQGGSAGRGSLPCHRTACHSDAARPSRSTPSPAKPSAARALASSPCAQQRPPPPEARHTRGRSRYYQLTKSCHRPFGVPGYCPNGSIFGSFG